MSRVTNLDLPVTCARHDYDRETKNKKNVPHHIPCETEALTTHTTHTPLTYTSRGGVHRERSCRPAHLIPLSPRPIWRGCPINHPPSKTNVYSIVLFLSEVFVFCFTTMQHHLASFVGNLYCKILQDIGRYWKILQDCKMLQE